MLYCVIVLHFIIHFIVDRQMSVWSLKLLLKKKKTIISFAAMNLLYIFLGTTSYVFLVDIFPRVGLLCLRLCVYSVWWDIVSFPKWLPRVIDMEHSVPSWKKRAHFFFLLWTFSWLGHQAFIIEVITPTLLSGVSADPCIWYSVI